ALFPYTTLFRSGARDDAIGDLETDGLRGRTGRQQHVRAGDGVVAVLTGDLDGVLAGELSGSEVGVDPASLDQSLQTLVVAGDDPVLVLEHLLDVDALELGFDAEGLGALGGVGDLGRVQKSLRRHAAAVQAGAANLVAFDQSDLHVEFCGSQSSGIATGSASQNDKVVGQ